MNVTTNVSTPTLTIKLRGFDEIKAFHQIINTQSAARPSFDTLKEAGLRKQLNDSIRSTGYIK